MNLRDGASSVLPLCLAMVVLAILAGFGVIAWVVPINVATVLVVLVLFVGWRTRGIGPSPTRSAPKRPPAE